MSTLMAFGQLLVVETEDDQYLGTVEVADEHLIVRSGYVGRPVVLDAAEVVSITVADEHPEFTA